MNNKIKLLITSVGSLVGQNILDALEYHQFYRRHKVLITGTNSIAENINNFRCDHCFLVPNTNCDQFAVIMKKIILETKPDLILSARDEDTEAIWQIMRSSPELKGVLPYGNLQTILYALDKWQTWLFTQNHRLPFAETILIGNPNFKTDLEIFINNVKFPLIAKPIRGFASKGVFYIRDWDDAETATGLKNYIIQEYLGDPEDLTDYFGKMDNLTPLFAHVPNDFLYSCHTIISPNGEVSPISISYIQHESGKTIMLRKYVNDDLKKIMNDYAEAYIAEGGVGPIGIQIRKDRNGNWKGWEMNARTNGNTFARLILGQDDLGLIMKYFLPERDFPVYIPDDRPSDNIIYKTLSCNLLNTNNIKSLYENKLWSK